MQISRRQFLALAGALGATATASVLAQPVRPLPFLITTQSDALLPKAAGKRVVICGGGWGGVSAARHLKKNNPAIEVVLLERNPLFFSCPMSNKWLVDVVDTNYLTWSYLDVASKYDYRFIQTEVLAFERDRKRVITAQGHVDYDYLIVAAGIRYNYEAWFGDDRRAEEYTRARYPAAYIPNAEHFVLKAGIQGFKGGDLVISGRGCRSTAGSRQPVYPKRPVMYSSVSFDDGLVKIFLVSSNSISSPIYMNAV